MPTVQQNEREVALLVEREPRNNFIFFMREVAQLGELATVTPGTTATEVGQLNDAAIDRIIPSLRETALLSSAATPTVLRTLVQRDTALLRSAGYPSIRVSDTVREVGELNDTAVGSATPVLRDVASLLSTSYPASTLRRLIRETALLKSRVLAASDLVVRDTAELNDAVIFTTGAAGVLRDTAQLNDAYYLSGIISAVVREAAKLSDDFAISLQALLVQRDVAFISDSAMAPSYGRAYTCSIASWGMSTFSNFPFKTMAGSFAAGDNLWRLDANDDYGAPISSHITTGVLDLGTSTTKRVSAVYAAGHSDGPLTVSVTADVDGTRQTYDYDMELRDQTDYRNNRALVGKGFRGRFVQFKIGGSAVKYTLLTAEADIAVSTRRL